MKDITVLGIDLAKNVFQMHGVNRSGKVVLRKKLSRDKLVEFVANLPKCLIGMEACGSAHYWARRFRAFGHEVKLMAPQFVKPYRKSSKNDRNDSEAIAEAVTRPNMRFVPIKAIEQQETQTIHRARSLLIKQRTALTNQIRGLLMEYGIILPQGISHIRKNMMAILEDAENELTFRLRSVFNDLYEQLKVLDNRIEVYNGMINKISKEDERCQRLMQIEGVGAIVATALVAAVGDAKVFKNGREMAAWLGLVPRQRSSGNKTVLLGITKRGDIYLRMLLIHGGRSFVKVCENKETKRAQWVKAKKLSAGYNKTSVAVANKNVRIAWALLTKNEDYKKSA